MSDDALDDPRADGAACRLGAGDARTAGQWAVSEHRAPSASSAAPGPPCAAGGSPAVRAACPGATPPTADPSLWWPPPSW